MQSQGGIPSGTLRHPVDKTSARGRVNFDHMLHGEMFLSRDDRIGPELTHVLLVETC